MRLAGKAFVAISREVGVPVATIHSWVKRTKTKRSRDEANGTYPAAADAELAPTPR